MSKCLHITTLCMLVLTSLLIGIGLGGARGGQFGWTRTSVNIDLQVFNNTAFGDDSCNIVNIYGLSNFQSTESCNFLVFIDTSSEYIDENNCRVNRFSSEDLCSACRKSGDTASFQLRSILWLLSAQWLVLRSYLCVLDVIARDVTDGISSEPFLLFADGTVAQYQGTRDVNYHTGFYTTLVAAMISIVNPVMQGCSSVKETVSFGVPAHGAIQLR
eukprot:jgi/Bigna1/69595/fgenesh1_pg.9_\